MKKDRKKTKITFKAFYMVLVLAEIAVIVAGASGILELIHSSVNGSRGVPDVVWLVIIGLFLGSSTTLFLVRFLSTPITTLNDAMKEVAGGNFDVRLDTTKGFSELREMSESFNTMTKGLQATETLQSDFVSNVSHEFKTPINAIEGYATLLLDTELSASEESKEYAEKILFNTKRLSSLVGNILLLSKLENQGIPSKASVYRLDEQIRQSILFLEPRWIERDTELDVELERIEYMGNEALLSHVFDNLIANAIKFGPRGGTVRLCLYSSDEGAVFTVEDEGEGIPKESIDRVFNKFYQSDTSHKSEGNGLGLALVSRILEVEGGSVKAENLPTRGAKFTVILPNTR